MTGIVLALAGLTAGDAGGGTGMTAPALAEVRKADPLLLIRPGMTLAQVDQLLGERGIGFGFGPTMAGVVSYHRAGISVFVSNYRVDSAHRSTTAPARPK